MNTEKSQREREKMRHRARADCQEIGEVIERGENFKNYGNNEMVGCCTHEMKWKKKSHPGEVKKRQNF